MSLPYIDLLCFVYIERERDGAKNLKPIHMSSLLEYFLGKLTTVFFYLFLVILLAIKITAITKKLFL